MKANEEGKRRGKVSQQQLTSLMAGNWVTHNTELPQEQFCSKAEEKG